MLARQILSFYLHLQPMQEAGLSLYKEVLEFASTYGYMPTLNSSRTMSEVSLT